MSLFEKGPGNITPLTEAEKAAVRERLAKTAPKLETKEDKEKRRAEFAAKMAGKSFDQMGETVVKEKYIPGNREGGSDQAA